MMPMNGYPRYWGLIIAGVLLALLASAQESAPAKKQTPKENAPQPRLDLYGDPLPEGAVARMGSRAVRGKM